MTRAQNRATKGLTFIWQCSAPNGFSVRNPSFPVFLLSCIPPFQQPYFPTSLLSCRSRFPTFMSPAIPSSFLPASLLPGYSFLVSLLSCIPPFFPPTCCPAYHLPTTSCPASILSCLPFCPAYILSCLLHLLYTWISCPAHLLSCLPPVLPVFFFIHALLFNNYHRYCTRTLCAGIFWP